MADTDKEFKPEMDNQVQVALILFFFHFYSTLARLRGGANLFVCFENMTFTVT